jgi:hypothetical protein
VAASWGAGLVGPVAGVSDKWHLWVDSLCLTDPTNTSNQLHCSHTHNAQIVHAVSDAATGPFVFADVAVAPSANNPAAVYHPQSKLYLLYYLDMARGGVMTPPVPSWAGMCTGAPANVTHAAAPAAESDGGIQWGHSKKACTGAGNCEVVAIQCKCDCLHSMRHVALHLCRVWTVIPLRNASCCHEREAKLSGVQTQHIRVDHGPRWCRR